ncbi:MAG TPA: ATPase domain-containing protein [Thermoplasmata archaeon]|nr:ATPase domain-containing protein [Thermoplasmata archaeon]
MCAPRTGRKSLRRSRGYARPRRRPRTERNRIKTYVRGLDEILGGGIPEGFVVLLTGAPGTMKSSFAYSILYQNALREGRKGAYFTLEQGKDLTLEHMASMGMVDPKAIGHITTLDMGNIRKNLSYLQGRGTWLELFKMYCNNVMKADAVSTLVVDSLDVLEAMAKLQDRRAELYFLFEWLRSLGPLTLLISERPLDLSAGAMAPEEAYLADGVITLEMHPTSDLFIQRRLRVAKMRATKHETGYYALSYGEGFEVTRAVTGSA